ncbi:glycosyltransferase [Deinococcus sp. JMULE3]|uniref:glycosyltransferase n=1 Tax=Deinococcus sp. JMULE3 TaxID=2518341 RepID=UPI0015771DD5|nr:glycosyltransferase [Deinococcus sp. JMULE3]NTY01075.1 glycosyltransferase [Deinococcus sp. JMULE3]
MKIAYFLQLNMPPSSGVFKKIILQAKEWSQSGEVVTLFISSKIKEYQDINIDGVNVVVAIYDGNLPSPLDGRLASINRLISEVNVFAPNIVYTRQDTFFINMLPLYIKHHVVTEVNTDDLSEIRHPSFLFMTYYKITRSIPLLLSKGAIYVSREISRKPYYARYNREYQIIANGIDLDNYPPLSINSDAKSFVFIGHHGQSWHGLDKIIKLAKSVPNRRFHVIGSNTPDNLENLPENISFHGYMTQKEYLPIFSDSVCAIASLAMHRNNMSEASPLKSREYLAFGLPIIAAYIDTDFPDGAEFILNLENVEDNIMHNIDAILAFAEHWDNKRVKRSAVDKIDSKVKEQQRLKFFRELI